MRSVAFGLWDDVVEKKASGVTLFALTLYTFEGRYQRPFFSHFASPRRGAVVKMRFCIAQEA